MNNLTFKQKIIFGIIIATMVNKITDKNVNRFKVARENNNFYINLFYYEFRKFNW